jgi:Ca2+-binding EF-hand superfamily protein
MDNSNNGKLDRQEFTWGLKENGHVLSPSEFERLFKYFDKNNDGVLNYNEFLVGLRGNLNARRRAVVQRAFKKFDKISEPYTPFKSLLDIPATDIDGKQIKKLGEILKGKKLILVINVASK